MKPVSFLSPRSLKHLVGHLDILIKGKLWVKVVFAMFAGIIAGIVMGPSVGWVDPDTAMALGNWLALPGLLFLAVVQMIVIPLIFSSIIRGLRQVRTWRCSSPWAPRPFSTFWRPPLWP
jgi:hypothetical protein